MMKPSLLMKISNVFCTVVSILSAIASVFLLCAMLILPEILHGADESLSNLDPNDVTAGFGVLVSGLAGGLSLLALIGIVVLLVICIPYCILTMIPAISGSILLRHYKNAADNTSARKKKNIDSTIKIIFAGLLMLYTLLVLSSTGVMALVVLLIFAAGMLLPAILTLKSESVE